MADKNYGPDLSRYLDPEETGFDTVVYQAGKPLLDSEFVLDQEIQNSERAHLLRQSMPSGYLTGDFAQDTNQDFEFRGEANTFHLVNKPVLNVNGSIIPLEYTDTTTPGENQIVLSDPPPLGAEGQFFADFVYVEVWRSLVGPNPSTDNKPAADKIYRHGNVLSASATWLDDNLIDTDPEINIESTKRVQVQYRIKHQRLVNEVALSAGMAYADANVFSQGPNTGVTTFAYTPVPSDTGLWRAGDGDPSNTLNTVDGYVYSVPLAIVFRRNQDGFDFRDNGNGSSLIASGTNLHPDGVYADEIIFDDILDLRNQVSLQGTEASSILERNVSLLMGQQLRSSAMYTQGAGWRVGGASFVSNLVLKADDLIPAGGNPYAAVTGFSGNKVGSVDGIRKTYTDKAHHEIHVERYETGVDWATPEITLTFDLTDVDGRDITLEQPDGTVIVDVLAVTLDDVDGGVSPVELPVLEASGLGTPTVSLDIDTTGVTSDRDIWVEYEIMYPAGSGLNAHVTELTSAYSITAHKPSEYNAAIGATFTDDDAGRAALREYIISSFSGPNRETSLMHTTEGSVALSVYSTDATTIKLPEALYEDATGTDAGVVSVAIGATTYAVDATATGGRVVVLADPLPTASEEVTVTYFPLRPLPAVDSTVTIFYKTNAIQAVPFSLLVDPLDVRPLLVPNMMHVGTGSSGSSTNGFPHEAGLQQIAVNINASYTGEHELDSPGPVSTTGFDALTATLKLPTLVPLAMPDRFRFVSPAETTTEQEERMGHYIAVEAGAYKPTAMAQSLSSSVTHKCFLPLLVQVTEATDFAREGEILMVILSNYIEFSPENVVAFTESDNTTCAAIYRLKGKPLTHAG